MNWVESISLQEKTTYINLKNKNKTKEKKGTRIKAEKEIFMSSNSNTPFYLFISFICISIDRIKIENKTRADTSTICYK